MDDVPLAPPVVVLTGAGVSTDSGIPDFRSPGGVWDRFDPMEFHVERLLADPHAFWGRRAELAAALDHLDAQANPVHLLLAEAVRRGDADLLVTQNVDGLHRRAGTPPERLIELHGDGSRCRCMECGATEGTREVLRRRPPGRAPECLGCGGLMKPDVVLFGEAVRGIPRAAAAAASCATLVACGTSLQVHPAAGLVDTAHAAGARIVLANDAPTPYDPIAHRILSGPVARTLPRLFPDAAGSLKGSLQ